VKLICNVLSLMLLLPTFLKAEVAETYQIEAGPATGIASRVAVDVIPHIGDSNAVWMATGHGATYSFDGGNTWYTAGTAQGLPSENLSAIFSVGGRVWVGSNHNELIEGVLTTLSDGLSYSDDDGLTWTTLDFSSGGLDIPYVEGGDRTVFDITGHTDPGYFNNRLTNNDADWLFFGAFAGGLLASQDGGTNWRRIFATNTDSIQFNLTDQAPSLRNRVFACAADTSHGDSLYLWSGTAAGVFQYVYAPPRDKLYSKFVNQVTFCEDWTSGGASRLFVGGESGLSMASAAFGHTATRFELDGLPSPGVSAVHCIGPILLAGGVDADGTASTELARSIDGGETFSTISGPWAGGTDSLFVDFVSMGGRVYLAMQTAGLFVSADSGLTWSPVPLDTLYSEPALRRANALDVLGDTLFVGTDAGLVNLTLDGAGDILAADNIAFEDTDSTGARVIKIRRQIWDDDFTTNNILWTVHQPVTAGGISMVGRFGPTVDSLFDTVTLDPLEVDSSLDTTGFVWNYYRRTIDIHDVNFFSDTVFAVGANSIWFSPIGAEMTNFFSARQYTGGTLVVASLDQNTVTAMEVKGDTVVFGCDNGIAISNNRGVSFQIYRANLDTLAADLVVNHSYISSLFGLAGDFIPALGVQYRGADPARIWAGARPADYGNTGISFGAFDPGSGSLEWETVLEEQFAWNFAFMGDTIFAATDDGLMMTNDRALDSTSTVWEKISFRDETSGELLVDPAVPVYGVAAVDSFLWVGTDDGAVRMSRSDLGSQQLYIRVDSTTAADEVYAFPVPFSPNQGQLLDFHFTVPTAENVTLEIYDFAMNLVARPIDNVYHEAGIYPAQGSQGVTWDGHNGRGDLVAVGVYYFKVEFDSGDARWGKLAVIP
jgi:hypothetical protein